MAFNIKCGLGKKAQMAFIEMLIGTIVTAPFAMSRWHWFRKIFSNNDR